MAKAWYTTREAVKDAASVSSNANMNKQIDRAINSASDIVEGMTHRKFYPEIATHYFAGSDFFVTSAGQLELYGYDLLRVDSMIINGNGVSSDLYFLDSEPMNAAQFPSDLISISAIDEVVITGMFGFTSRDILETVIVANVGLADTTVDVDDSSYVGVGHTIRIDDERLKVLEKQQLSSGQTLQTAMTTNASNTLVAVSSGPEFNVGEVVLIGAEKLLITDIAGNNLIVQRSYDGSTLAAHDVGTPLYIPRRLKVSRGSLGTTPATHLAQASVYVLQAPSLVQTLCLAEALNILNQQKSGYAKSVGTRDSLRDVGGQGLPDLRKSVMTNYRKYRGGAA